MYAVLDDLYYGVHLTGNKVSVNEQGDIETLLELHRELDSVVADAYGLPLDLDDDEILERLLELNQKTVTDEKAGTVLWLRANYQTAQ